MDLLGRELRSLRTHGVDVQDMSTGEFINVRVFTITAGADYRGLEDMLGITGAPRVTYACYRCWLQGSPGPHKVLYGGAYRWLASGDSLRSKAYNLNNKKVALPNRKALAASHQQLGHEITNTTTITERNKDDLPPALRTKADLLTRSQVNDSNFASHLGDFNIRIQCLPCILLICDIYIYSSCRYLLVLASQVKGRHCTIVHF